MQVRMPSQPATVTALDESLIRTSILSRNLAFFGSFVVSLLGLEIDSSIVDDSVSIGLIR